MSDSSYKRLNAIETSNAVAFRQWVLKVWCGWAEKSVASMMEKFLKRSSQIDTLFEVTQCWTKLRFYVNQAILEDYRILRSLILYKWNSWFTTHWFTFKRTQYQWNSCTSILSISVGAYTLEDTRLQQPCEANSAHCNPSRSNHLHECSITEA